MAGRLYPPRDPVTFTLDGARVVAERGEPVAAALVAAGITALARSPKFHRPRGPACMRGACDGCLARVEGEPNVMTCLTPATPGLEVLTQNALGTRELDLLRVTDWFFPDGLNHHELFAGVPGVQAAMQLFARRVAGLGRLPDTARPLKGAARRRVPVLVIGGGAAGMAVAAAIARRGRPVEVVDDGLVVGGGARGLSAADDPVLAAAREAFEQAVSTGSVTFRPRTVAGAVFGRDVLLVGPSGAEIAEPAALVLATGAHDGVVPFENNDFPGVHSARAACLLAASGAAVGQRVVILTPRDQRGDGEDAAGGISFADAFERIVERHAALGAPKTDVTRVTGVTSVRGSTRLRAVVVSEGGAERVVPADALLVDAPRAPAYELAAQAGASLEHRPAGHTPVATRGKLADGVWAIGEVTGDALSPRRFALAAEEIAQQILA